METSPVISLIAALGENRVIGIGNRLPWHLSADLRHFKQLTLNKPIVMGRGTWESLPGLLPQRIHIVISTDKQYSAPGCVVVPSPDAALAVAGAVPEVMVVGGASIYRQMLPLARRMYLTQVHGVFDGDAFFPEWAVREWREVSREDHPADTETPLGYSFLRLERR